MAESEREAKIDELPLVLQQRERELKKALEDRHLLLWLHAEAVWERDSARTVADRLGWRFVGAQEDAERERSSRQAWAAEAMRLQQQIDDEAEPAYWDFPHQWTDGGGGDPYYGIRSHCGACGKDYDDPIHDEPYGEPPAQPGPNAPCACVSDEHADQLANAGFTRPVCAVHPDGGDA